MTTAKTATPTPTEQVAKATGAMARWRKANRRIDYAPSAAALAVIEQHRSEKLDPTTVGVIDALVLAGHRSISGKNKEPSK